MSNVISTVKAVNEAAPASVHVGGSSYRLPRATLARVTKPIAEKSA